MKFTRQIQKCDMSLSDYFKEYYWGNGHHHIINLKLLQVKAKTKKKQGEKQITCPLLRSLKRLIANAQ